MARMIPYTIFVEEGQEIEAVRIRPAAAVLSEKSSPSILGGSNSGCVKGTFKGGEADGEADVTFDF